MSENWNKLTKEQQIDLQSLREHAFDHIHTEVEFFTKKHPEIQVSWSCTFEGFTREVIKPLNELLK